jgi:putative ABC transport system permease protein
MKFGERLRSALWKQRVEDEVDSELAFHVEMRTREYVARGMSASDARELAIRRFGDINRVNHTCRDIGRLRDRDVRRTEYFSELVQDVTFAIRQMIKNPAFTVVAVVTLALGIGATTAIFSAVKAVVLQPLPFPHPDRIMAIYEDTRNGRGNVSAGNYVDGIEPVQKFEAVTAVQYSSFNLSDAGQPERVVGARATWGFFQVFSMAPAKGRVFTRDEDQPGHEQVVVLSHRLWTRRFGSDTSIVGREIKVNGRPYEVIGVMPAAFDFTAQTEELWVPIAFTPERKTLHDEHYLQVYGRLKPGAIASEAVAELQVNAGQLRTSFPNDNAQLQFAAVTALEELVGDYPRRLYTLLGAVGFVLLIACGNIANLLLARGAARSTELAIRTSLGAGRGRIVRQLLTESVVLALISAVAGLAVAAWGIQALIAAAPQGVPRLEQTTIDGGVMAFAVVVALGAALLFGLAPATRAARTDVQGMLKEGGRGGSLGAGRDRLRSVLIAVELALTLLLLVGAGLLIRSSLALQRVNSGFDPSGVMSARLALPAAEFPDHDQIALAFNQLADRVKATPGTEQAALTTQIPMGPGGNSNGLIPEGRAFDMRNAIQSRLRMVSPGYFSTMRIPIIKGRDIADADRRGAVKVMVVSQSFADAAFPGQDPIGKRVACCEPAADGKSPDYKTIVGVVGNVRWRGPGIEATPEFYLPLAQAPRGSWDWIQRTMYVVVRTSLTPEAMSNPLRMAAADVAPGVPLFGLMTMEQRIVNSLATARFNTLLLTLLSAIGLVLAVVGIYGVIAYFVTRRTQEIGVRMALGATRADVVRLVIGQAARPVALGVVLGVIASGFLTRVLTSQLFGVTPGDPVTFALVATALAAIGLLASLVPAARAASVDPTRALHMN